VNYEKQRKNVAAEVGDLSKSLKELDLHALELEHQKKND